jgi:hypothetical protein
MCKCVIAKVETIGPIWHEIKTAVIRKTFNISRANAEKEVSVEIDWSMSEMGVNLMHSM